MVVNINEAADQDFRMGTAHEVIYWRTGGPVLSSFGSWRSWAECLSCRPINSPKSLEESRLIKLQTNTIE